MRGGLAVRSRLRAASPFGGIMDETWLLIRRDFLKGTGLMLILPYTRRRKRRGTPIGLLLVLTRT
jgi:hypothetical protein